jgi:aminoglycoside phosphotransferase (APT) family kinase protein
MTFTPEQIIHAIKHSQTHITAVDVESLSGGVSAYMYKLGVVINATHHTWVFRAYKTVHNEYLFLTQAHSKTNLPVPTPLYYEDDPNIFPSPYLIMSYIEHDRHIADMPAQPLARMLSKIHTTDITGINTTLSAKLHQHIQQSPDHPLLQVLNNALPHVRYNAPTLNHGDYWGGNILWHRGDIIGVIDWEDVAMGDPVADLGKSRLEFLWQFDDETVQRYTQHYQYLMPHLDYRYLPFWDLWGAWLLRGFTDWIDDPIARQQMQTKYDYFIKSAQVKLAQQIQ